MYEAGIDGPFAAHCQRLLNQHRLPFHDAASLSKWEPDSVATATKLNKTGKLSIMSQLILYKTTLNLKD
jgi:hypothetical protein